MVREWARMDANGCELKGAALIFNFGLGTSPIAVRLTFFCSILMFNLRTVTRRTQRTAAGAAKHKIFFWLFSPRSPRITAAAAIP